MGWYDLFASFYDSSLEALYVDARAAATKALRVQPGMRVLDLPCGTGQSFDTLVPAVGDEGTVVGVDLSRGMLRKAERRVEANGWSNVLLEESGVIELDAQRVEELLGRAHVERVHVFLGMTAFPDPQAAFDNLWSLLAPGGRMVIVDVYAESPTFQGRMVNLVARADIRRRVWEPLEAVGTAFEREELPSKPQHGGTLVLATATKN